MLDGFRDGRSRQDAEAKERNSLANIAGRTESGRQDAEMLCEALSESANTIHGGSDSREA